MSVERLPPAEREISVLVIEDSPSYRVLVHAFLSDVPRVRFRLFDADTLARGMALAAEIEPDAVLLDLSLPDSFGVESCVRFAAAAPQTPIVVLTGLDDEETAVAALKAGAQDYLVKGQFDRHLLSRALQYAIERKRAAQALERAKAELEQRVEERTFALRQEMEERKRVEEQSRRQQEELAHVARLNTLGEMASGLAHELNQPLMAITSYADTCLQKLRGDHFDLDELIMILKDTSSEARRAGEIIKRLRRLVGRRPSQKSEVDVNDVIRETIPLLAPLMRRTATELIPQLAPSLPAVPGDRVQIQQVILNLANNAMQAMQVHNSPRRELTIATRLDRATECVVVQVADTGPGVPAENLSRLFDPFFTTGASGLGLGLSISRSIIEGHSGRMTVHPNPRDGLTFEFTLPLASAPSPAAQQP